MIQGHLYREDREWERAAFVASHVINMAGKTVKRDVTAAELLGREPKIPSRYLKDVDERRASALKLLRHIEGGKVISSRELKAGGK